MTETPAHTGAILSHDRTYRYRLWRTWELNGPGVAFIMLNPSTADENVDDATIRRCMGFARDWGYDCLMVGNLFALRATDPGHLQASTDPIGPRNDRHLRKIAEWSDKTVVAWGTKGSLLGRDHDVLDLLDDQELHALDVTKDGHPAHPLYQPKDAELQRYNQ